MKPPNMTSIILSPSSGSKSKMLRKSEESATCIIEKITKRLLIEPQHSIATGMLSSSMPSDVEMWTPPRDVIWLTRTATPVNPLGSRLAGSTNAWMRKVCSRAEAVTATAVMARRTMVSRASSRVRSTMLSMVPADMGLLPGVGVEGMSADSIMRETLRPLPYMASL